MAHDPTAAPAALAASDLPIHRITLRAVTNTARFRTLDRLEAYWRCRQYDGLRYDWDGNYQGYGGEADIKPGWFVPLKRRKPNTRMELAKTIVGRFSALLFGNDGWPEIQVGHDEEAEDYLRSLVRVSKLPVRMLEARNLGGAIGTAAVSIAVVDGRPRIQVHNAKNCTVLAWAEPADHTVGAVLEAYSYRRQVWENGKLKHRDYYYARYWDTEREVLWAPIPKAVGDEPGWTTKVRHAEVTHGYGLCPFYWIQNLPDSQDLDGESDFEGLTDDMDAINRLLSATGKGTIANVDPTLVVKEDPALNDGNVQKGSGKAIFSRGGAEYLEIKGDAVRAAVELLKVERGAVLEAAQCVILDPDGGSAGVVSGEALRLKYAPMIAKSNLHRGQYGAALETILGDFLKIARTLGDGAVVLPDRTEVSKPKRGEEGETKTKTTPRTPGLSEDVSLTWGPHFPHTWTDIKNGVEAAKNASGGKAVVSQRTAIQMVAAMTGVEDPDRELAVIDTDAEMSADRQMRAFGGGPGPAPKAPPPFGKPGAGPPAPPAKAPPQPPKANGKP